MSNPRNNVNKDIIFCKTILRIGLPNDDFHDYHDFRDITIND